MLSIHFLLDLSFVAFVLEFAVGPPAVALGRPATAYLQPLFHSRHQLARSSN